MIWALIPVKSFQSAKQRLSGILSPIEREALCRAMLEDVLSVLSHRKDIEQLWIVSADPEVAQLADDYGVTLLDERQLNTDNLNSAVTEAAAHLSRLGAKTLLIMHGDLPLISNDDIDNLLATHHRQDNDSSLVIVTDRERNGSNCMLVTPPTVIPFCYGNHSFEKHRQHAHRLQLSTIEYSSKRLSLDIDKPDDLIELLHSKPKGLAKATFEFLELSGVGKRISSQEGLQSSSTEKA